MLKRYRWWIGALVFSIVAFFFYDLLSEDKQTVEEFANEFFSYTLPTKTKIIEKGYDYGVSYGGGPWGSGGQPTAVAYMKLSSELSEKELLDYYEMDNNESLKGFEIYFKGDEEIKKTFDGKHSWYEGTTPSNPSNESNKGEPIEFIVQKRTVFDSPLGEFVDVFR
ncbi:hypothetical protein [Psychrobacillus sp. OK032]|uniref:hypothetical protein n=1 Tax=Psychrobacillus sp. OK032 TaxID=1884358 RepID=UPI0008AC14BF|nr:hypothetical protein [Psychrobacillus sp. OK032]SER97386.1 hypothetical protein SAMN05518872_1031 [Psychrobacillus sp. OK032]